MAKQTAAQRPHFWEHPEVLICLFHAVTRKTAARHPATLLAPAPQSSLARLLPTLCFAVQCMLEALCQCYCLLGWTLAPITSAQNINMSNRAATQSATSNYLWAVCLALSAASPTKKLLPIDTRQTKTPPTGLHLTRLCTYICIYNSLYSRLGSQTQHVHFTVVVIHVGALKGTHTIQPMPISSSASTVFALHCIERSAFAHNEALRGDINRGLVCSSRHSLTKSIAKMGADQSVPQQHTTLRPESSGAGLHSLESQLPGSPKCTSQGVMEFPVKLMNPELFSQASALFRHRLLGGCLAGSSDTPAMRRCSTIASAAAPLVLRRSLTHVHIIFCRRKRAYAC